MGEKVPVFRLSTGRGTIAYDKDLNKLYEQTTDLPTPDGWVEVAGGAGTVDNAAVADAVAEDPATVLSALGLTEEDTVLPFEVFGPTSDVTTGDSKVVFPIDSILNGHNVVAVRARTTTAGVTGTTDIQVHRLRGVSAVDILSTKATIDSTEKTTTTAATAAVVNTANDDLQTDDELHIDVDAVSSGTAPKGLWVYIVTRIP